MLALGDGACLQYGDRVVELLAIFEGLLGVFAFYFFS